MDPVHDMNHAMMLFLSALQREIEEAKKYPHMYTQARISDLRVMAVNGDLIAKHVGHYDSSVLEARGDATRYLAFRLPYAEKEGDVCEECGKDSGLHSIYCSMHEKYGVP